MIIGPKKIIVARLITSKPIQFFLKNARMIEYAPPADLDIRDAAVKRLSREDIEFHYFPDGS